MSTKENGDAVASLEAQGYIVIPPEDLPEVITDESELVARVDGLDRMAFVGGLFSRQVQLPSSAGSIYSNHSIGYEYRRVVAHAAMAKWYVENLPFEQKVLTLRNELLKAEGMEWFEAKPKQMKRMTKQARALLRTQQGATA